METLNAFIGYLIDGKILKAFQYLADESEKWGEALANGVKNAIASIFKFIKGGGLDNVLEIGTNIIQGICKGIDNSYNSGTLTETITKIIGKIADWISTNAPAIEKAGRQILDAIKVGIENNQDKIRSAMEGICGIIEAWVSGTSAISTLMGHFADVMISSFISQTAIKMKARAEELWIAMNQGEVTSKAQDSGLVNGDNFSQGVNDGLEKGKSTITAKGTEIGTETAEAINNALMEMDTTDVLALNQSMIELAEVTEDTSLRMAKAFGVIRNSARDQFVGLVNIIRNQCLNMTNIIRNQSKNSRDAFTGQMMSMHRVARNQMSNILASIKEYMGYIKNQLSQSLTMDIKKTITTSYVTKKDGEQSFGTMALLSNMTGGAMAIPSPNTMATATSGSMASVSGGSSYEFSIPLYVDGREIAKATATYNQAELNKLNKRKSRKQGI
jgi:hypothetical protein